MPFLQIEMFEPDKPGKVVFPPPPPDTDSEEASDDYRVYAPEFVRDPMPPSLNFEDNAGAPNLALPRNPSHVRKSSADNRIQIRQHFRERLRRGK